MASHSSTRAWEIPWTEEPGGLQPAGVAKSRTRLSDFTFTSLQEFSGASVGREPACQAGDAGSRPGEGNGSPLQYPCLENPVDRGAWRAAARGHTHTHTHVHCMCTSRAQTPHTHTHTCTACARAGHKRHTHTHTHTRAPRLHELGTNATHTHERAQAGTRTGSGGAVGRSHRVQAPHPRAPFGSFSMH